MKYFKQSIPIKPYSCHCGLEIVGGICMNGPDGTAPAPGMVLICVDCFSLHLVGPDGVPFPMPAEMLEEIKKSPKNWLNLQLSIDKIKRAKDGNPSKN